MAAHQSSTWSFDALSTVIDNTIDSTQSERDGLKESEPVAEDENTAAAAHPVDGAINSSGAPECADRDRTRVEPSTQPDTTSMNIQQIRGPNYWIHELSDRSPHTSPPVVKLPVTWTTWINANTPQPADRRTVTAGEVRGLTPTVEVSTLSSKNLRDRIHDCIARDCGICFNRIAEGAMGRCGHVYCSACLIEEALRERKCPLCKQVLIPVELRIVVGGEEEEET